MHVSVCQLKLTLNEMYVTMYNVVGINNEKNIAVYKFFVISSFSPGNLGKYYNGLYISKTCLSLVLTICAQLWLTQLI